MLGSLEAVLIPLFEQLYRTFGYSAVVLAMAIESACIPLPSEIILPMAGWMVSLKIFTLLGVTLAGTLGCILGSTVAYWVGYVGGRPLLDRYGRYVLISSRDLATADHWFTRHGELAIFFSRLLPVVRTFISLPAGIARMNFGRFILYTALGSVPWSFALAYAGLQLGNNWETVRASLARLDYVVLALFLVAVVWYIRHHLRGLARPSATESR